MLKYNNIESLINRTNTPITKLAYELGVGESTLRGRLKKKNLTPNDVEKIADYFGKSILYFFDREEESNGGMVLQEPGTGYGKCAGCVEKDKEIKYLKAIIEAKEDALVAYRGKKEKPLENCS